MKALRKHNRGRLAAVEHVQKIGVRADILHSQPLRGSDRIRARHSCTRHDDLIENEPRHNDIRVKASQQVKVASSAQVDERPSVWDDDQPTPCVSSSV